MRILTGDCLDILPTLDAESVDACVTDPPAGISFMGRDWDSNKGGRRQWVAWMTEVFTDVHRVLKPGGHGLVWALPRTSHWTAWALEDAGFEVRDKVMHLFGTGFPKSKNLEGDWQGWGTALKPAHEDWWLIRKPLAGGTVAANVLAHGTGALNVDGCRIEGGNDYHDLSVTQGGKSGGGFDVGSSDGSRHTTFRPASGRWPANVVLSHELECQEVGTNRGQDGREDVRLSSETVTAWECTETCAVRLLDEQSGERKTTGTYTRSVAVANAIYGRGRSDVPVGGIQTGYGDTGGASRFFLTVAHDSSSTPTCAPIENDASQTRFLYTAKASRAERGAYNDHATVKPLALMQWLVRLVTPPGGLVLDPFLGSGTTALACQREGFNCIGIERDEHSVEIALRRLSEAEDMFSDVTVVA